MFERFTEPAIKVIMLAQEEARRLGHNFVGTEQILLGLIGEGTGVAAKVLKSADINLKDARIEVEKIIGRGSGFVAVEIPFTPRARRVLELSLEEARKLGHDYIGTEHLLLGMIREGEGVAARVMEIMGAELPKIRTAVIRMLAETADIQTPAPTDTPSGSTSRDRKNKLNIQRVPPQTETAGTVEASDTVRVAISTEAAGYFPTANGALVCLGSFFGSATVETVTLLRSPEGNWWLEVPENPEAIYGLVAAAGGRTFGRRDDSWINVGSGGLVPATGGESVRIADWSEADFADLLAATSGLSRRYRGTAQALVALIPGALGQLVMQRAIAIGLQVSAMPAVWEPLTENNSSPTGILVVRLEAAGDRTISAAFVQQLGKLPYVAVTEALGTEPISGLLVDVRQRLPIPVSIVTDLLPADETWFWGPAGVGFWRVRLTGETVDGSALMQLTEPPEPMMVSAEAAVNVPEKIPVRLVARPGAELRIDGVLVDDKELGWLRVLLLGRPVGESAFVIPGAGRHLLTAPGGLVGQVPFGVPVTWVGPGALYVQLGKGFYPALSAEARQQSFPVDAGSAVAVVEDATYQFAIKHLIPAWSLWLGEIPQVKEQLSLPAKKIMAKISSRLFDGEQQKVVGQLGQVQREADRTLGVLEQAMQAELAGELVKAAEILEQGGYLAEAGRLYERAAALMSRGGH